MQLSPNQRRLFNALMQHGGGCESTIPEDKPVPDGVMKMVERGWIKLGRTRIGPLGIYTGMRWIGLTEEGKMIAKLNGLPE